MSGNNAKQLESDIINNELINIDNWIGENKLSINFSRTEYMLISKKKDDSKFNFSINNNEIRKRPHQIF